MWIDQRKTNHEQRATNNEVVGCSFSAPTAPIPFEEIMEVSRVTIELAESGRG